MEIYLNFKGNTEAAFKFYKSVFGGEFSMLQRYKDMPDAANLGDDDKEKIMHIALPMGKNMLMGADIPKDQELVAGNNFYISLNAESNSEAERVFKALSEGGKVQMPLNDTFWGAYFGMLKDRFGIQWMVSHEYRKDEVKK